MRHNGQTVLDAEFPVFTVIGRLGLAVKDPQDHQRDHKQRERRAQNARSIPLVAEYCEHQDQRQAHIAQRVAQRCRHILFIRVIQTDAVVVQGKHRTTEAVQHQQDHDAPLEAQQSAEWPAEHQCRQQKQYRIENINQRYRRGILVNFPFKFQIGTAHAGVQGHPHYHIQDCLVGDKDVVNAELLRRQQSAENRQCHERDAFDQDITNGVAYTGLDSRLFCIAHT